MTDLGDFEAGGPRAIGTLTVREGLRLSEDPDDDRIEAYVTPEHREAVRLRSYAVVPLPDDREGREAHLFCRIEGLRYGLEFAADDATAIHARRAMGQDGIDERDYKFIASLRPLATLVGDVTDPEALRRRQPDTLPKPDTTVRQAHYDAEIKAGLKLPHEGLFVGHLAVGGELVRTPTEPSTVDYRLRDRDATDPLVFRHVLVAGGTGSGKTHAAKNLLRQLFDDERRYEMPDGRRRRPAVVVVDPQDEYAQLHDDNPTLDDATRRRLRRERIAHDGVDDTTVFVPDVADTSYAANAHRAEQVRFSLPFELVRRNRWLIAGGRLNERQHGALDRLVPAYFDRHGADPTYAGFVEFVESDPEVHDMVASGQIHESTHEAVLRRVDQPTFRRVFDRPATSVIDLVDRLVRPGGLSTIPTYHLGDGRQRALVVLAVASLLVDEKLTSDPRHDRIAETPLVLAMDEAHNYLAEGQTVQARRIVGKFTEAAKQGRKERLGLFLVTQDPGDIADPIFKQVNTRVALNLGDEEAVASLNLPRRLAAQVPDLETGQMVVHSPDNAEPVQVIGLPECVVKHDPR
ncbi:MAG: ATP-binding protein [Halobacteriales archaeon]